MVSRLKTHGTAVMFIIAWLLFFGLLVFLFGRFEKNENNPNSNITTEVGAQGEHIIHLRANRQNQYVMSGRINDIPVIFILDTGATHVVVPDHIAEKCQLARSYPMRARTANGIITVYSTQIEKLELGDITLRHINASINPHMPGNEILLGMSALKKFEITHKKGELIIKYKP